MEISEKGKCFIKSLEGFRKKPYKDGSGWSVGYGFNYSYIPPDTTLEEANRDFEIKIVRYSGAVDDAINHKITQNLFDMLVSFTYNVGIYAFNNSTLLKKVNDGLSLKEIGEEFKIWIFSEGKKHKGLILRRIKEVNYFYKKKINLLFFLMPLIILGKRFLT